MPETTLFIGVVSHLGTRFQESQGQQGLAARLAKQIPGSSVCVNTQNLLSSEIVDVSPRVFQESLTEELALEREWVRYLGTAKTPRWWFRHGLRWARRATRAILPPDKIGITRLLNIELSHLDLIRRGLETDAPWILILEDDAQSSDIRDLAEGLTGLMKAQPNGFVNLSKSFPLTDLGIERLLSPSAITWQGSIPRQVLDAKRPTTNTVCAILYSRSFMIDLVQAWEAVQLTPVVPIDWKLNRVLMALHTTTNQAWSPCLFVEPAPIIQMSMQPPGILHT